MKSQRDERKREKKKEYTYSSNALMELGYAITQLDLTERL
jgi:hypothetical protein